MGTALGNWGKGNRQVAVVLFFSLVVEDVASLAQVGTIIALFPGEADQSPASGRPLTAAAGHSRWLLATHGSPWQPTATGAAAYAVAGNLWQPSSRLSCCSAS